MDEEKPVKGMVSNRDSAVAAAICSLLAAVVTWAILEGPYQSVIVDNGSVADWIAAAGTWVIGIMAWRFQKEAHRQRLAESTQQKAREHEVRLVRFSTMILRAHNASRVWDRFRSLPREMTLRDLNYFSARLKMKVSCADLERLTWPAEDRAMLSATAALMLDEVEWRMLHAQQIYETFISIFDEPGKVFDNSEEGLLDDFGECLKDIGHNAAGLRMLIVVQRNREAGIPEPQGSWIHTLP